MQNKLKLDLRAQLGKQQTPATVTPAPKITSDEDEDGYPSLYCTEEPLPLFQMEMEDAERRMDAELEAERQRTAVATVNNCIGFAVDLSYVQYGMSCDAAARSPEDDARIAAMVRSHDDVLESVATLSEVNTADAMIAVSQQCEAWLRENAPRLAELTAQTGPTVDLDAEFGSLAQLENLVC